MKTITRMHCRGGKDSREFFEPYLADLRDLGAQLEEALVELLPALSLRDQILRGHTTAVGALAAAILRGFALRGVRRVRGEVHGGVLARGPHPRGALRIIPGLGIYHGLIPSSDLVPHAPRDGPRLRAVGGGHQPPRGILIRHRARKVLQKPEARVGEMRAAAAAAWFRLVVVHGA